ncbi:trehalose 6-P phosphatase, glycosyltransferase family 20 protein [Pseudohyphozyma bogoriensis]|nr:trehalose 6-P phosphatase, glycosyltransferase family 20 protein [Pseudohyphozyma bogoriensis]
MASRRLSLTRPRASSRPPANGEAIRKQSYRGAPVTLTDLRDDEEWEPTSDEPNLTLDEVREAIAGWEDELKAKNRVLSGRTIVVVHSLPYVCTLHPTTKSHTTLFDHSVLPTPTDELPPLFPTGERASTPLAPGDPLLRPNPLHFPPPNRAPSPTHPVARKPNPITSFTAPGSSLSPSSHPPCPPSRAPSPDTAALAKAERGPQLHRWVLHPRRGHAALNSGLKSLSAKPLVVVGRPDDLVKEDVHISQAELGDEEKKDLEKGLKKMSEEGEGMGCIPVWLDDKVHTAFYEGMCKTFLWPIFHYLALPDSIDKKQETAAWEAYYETNLVYAKKVAETYQEGDLIWIHDYHLLLVPKMLRELLPDANPYISLFLHCPFPSSEYFRNLPRREALLDGMLGCNLVVFQTHSYARHFLSSCVRVMGYEAGHGGVDAKGSITRVAYCPIGIDVDNVERDRKAPGVEPKIEALRRLYKDKKIIVGRDKLDPTKGVLPKLLAFEKFLSDYPEWEGKVVLIQVTSPSPGDSPALATKVSELVDQINAAHGTLEFQPVHHYHQTVERDEYFALLTVADLALITSTRDGMNTTSMEYIMCQAEARGSIIVSEFTGVAATLNKAVKVNPWDLGGVARAIDQCLKMPMSERILRHGVLYQNTVSQTAAVWAATNILKLLESLQGEQATQNTPPLQVDSLLAKYRAANKRLLLFDYDGTLTPIVKNPSDALPSQLLLDSLKTITSDPKNVVYIISGRDGDFLEEHLGHIENLGMSAEHGCFIKAPGSKKWISLTDDLNMDWKRDVLQIFRYYEARTQGAFVEKKISSVTFHYRNADPVFGLFQAKECQAMLESMQESLPIDVLVGKKNVEVRPAHTNKGEIVQRLLYLHHETEFCMCAGDDKTDEDMFHSMARVSSSTSSGSPPTISPPNSLRLFPSLAAELPPDAYGDDPNGELQPVESKLDPNCMYMIAIEKDGQARMTMANALLPTAEEMVSLLAKMAESP